MEIAPPIVRPDVPVAMPEAAGFVPRAGGLLVPSRVVEVPRPALVAASPELARHLDAAHVRAEAARGWREMHDAHGEGFANTVMDGVRSLIDTVERDERHAAVMRRFGL